MQYIVPSISIDLYLFNNYNCQQQIPVHNMYCAHHDYRNRLFRMKVPVSEITTGEKISSNHSHP